MTSPNQLSAMLMEGPSETGLWASFTYFGVTRAWLWPHSWNLSWVGQKEGN